MIEKKGKRKKERKKEKRIEIRTKKRIKKTQFSPNFGLCACLKNQNEA